MKVSDVMQKHVEFITPGNSVLEVSRLIFGRGINGLPVCKNKKIVGFITERDILAKFYPSMQEYVEDRVHSSDFEGMEDKIWKNGENFMLVATKLGFIGIKNITI